MIAPRAFILRMAGGLFAAAVVGLAAPAWGGPQPASRDGLIQAMDVLSTYAAETPVGRPPAPQMKAAANSFIFQAQALTRGSQTAGQIVGAEADLESLCRPAAQLMAGYRVGLAESDEVVLSAGLFSLHCISAWLAARDARAPETGEADDNASRQAVKLANDAMTATLAAGVMSQDSLTRARALRQLAADWDNLVLPLTVNEKTRLGFRLVERARLAPADSKEDLLQLALRTAQAPCATSCQRRSTGSFADRSAAPYDLAAGR